MTREEKAIKYIQNLLKSREDKRGKTEVDIALEMAVEALKVKSVLLNKIENAKEEIKNRTPWDASLVEMYELLLVLDKLIKNEDSNENM